MRNFVLSLAILLPAAGFASPISYTSNFDPSMASGVTGSVQLVLDNSDLTVNVNASGVQNSPGGTFNYSQMYSVSNSDLYRSQLMMGAIMPFQVVSFAWNDMFIGSSSSPGNGATGYRMDLPAASAALTLATTPAAPAAAVSVDPPVAAVSEPVNTGGGAVAADAVAAPEPAAFALLGLGLVSLGLMKRVRQ